MSSKEIRDDLIATKLMEPDKGKVEAYVRARLMAGSG